jgi:hypothetical protein
VEQDCSELEAAHGSLLKASFSVERHFEARLNGKLVVRETTLLSYADGKLTKEVIEKEVFDKRVALEEGPGDPAVDLPFACERVRQLEDGRYELSSADGNESVLFSWDREEGILVPIAWINTEKKRFLFKKFLIEARATYHNFVLQPAISQ